MAYQVSVHPAWIHVEFIGDVDACDIIHQHKQSDFQTQLLEKKRIVYDYRKATDVLFDTQDLDCFATLGKVMAGFTTISVVVIPRLPDKLEHVSRYQQQTSGSQWHVSVAASLDEAKKSLQIED